MIKFLGCELIHTTAYNPKAYGLVERYHRVLKAFLKAQSNPNEWYSNLGWILLGLRFAVRDDFEFSPAEIVFGTSLRLPGEYFSTPNHRVSSAEYVSQLQQFIKILQPVPTRKITSRVMHVDSKLSTWSHVFVRNDGVKIGLQRPYNGPFRFLQRSDKYFQLNMNGTIGNVCIDRLNPQTCLTRMTLSNSKLIHFFRFHTKTTQSASREKILLSHLLWFHEKVALSDRQDVTVYNACKHVLFHSVFVILVQSSNHCFIASCLS